MFWHQRQQFPTSSTMSAEISLPLMVKTVSLP